VSELLCFAPPTTATSAHLFPCSDAPVANKRKDTGRCHFLIRDSGIARDYNLIPRHLSALFVTVLTEVATPGDSLLQQASAGKPNQQDQRRLPEWGLPFLTAPPEWHGGDTPTPYERIAHIGGFVGAADGLDVVLEACGQCEAFYGHKFSKSSFGSRASFEKAPILALVLPARPPGMLSCCLVSGVRGVVLLSALVIAHIDMCWPHAHRPPASHAAAKATCQPPLSPSDLALVMTCAGTRAHRR
jgi:hypothetical protein